jgi:hypothetical protein
VLRRGVESLHLLFVRKGCARLCAVRVRFEGGAQRDYLLVSSPAANRRPGWTRDYSFATAGLPADVDLRDRAASCLESRMLEIDFASL